MNNENKLSLEEEFIEVLEDYIDARIKCADSNQDCEHYYTSHSEKRELLDVIRKILKIK